MGELFTLCLAGYARDCFVDFLDWIGAAWGKLFHSLVANPKTVANFAENLFVHRSF
jgi:hypothetical protein